MLSLHVKCPTQHVALYIGKELRLLPQEDIPVDYGYEFTLPLESPEGVPCYHFTSDIKNPPYTHCIGKIPLCRERITSFVSKVNPCAFITEIDINLIYILQGQQSENIDCQ